MLDALNAIVEFLSSIWSNVLTFLSFSSIFNGFISLVTRFGNVLFTLIPVQFAPFAYVTLVLSVVLLIVGRSNNDG